MLAQCYGHDTPLLPPDQLPALVRDFVLARELDVDGWLGAAGLCQTDLLPDAEALTPGQLLQLLRELKRRDGGADASFLLGASCLPGRFGAASLGLMQAGSLRDVLDLLVSQQALMSPLLGPRYRIEGGTLMVYWTDSIGAGALLPFLVEMQMSALKALCRSQLGQHLPWRYRFNRTRPQHIEQHQVQLGHDLGFDSQFDAMLLDAHWLDHPWPSANPAALMLVRQALAAHPPAYAISVRQAVYDHIWRHIAAAPTLDSTAAALGASPATLKRRLARHGEHFQALLDLVRTHISVCLLHHHGKTPAELAEYLGYHDARNFRRSLKRWTGGWGDDLAGLLARSW